MKSSHLRSINVGYELSLTAHLPTEKSGMDWKGKYEMQSLLYNYLESQDKRRFKFTTFNSVN